MACIDDVIERYNDLAIEYGFRYRRLTLRKKKSRDREDARDYLEWCEDHGVDPIGFMEARFVWLWDRGGKYVDFATLPSDSFIDVWEEFADLAFSLRRDAALMKRHASEQRDQELRAAQPLRFHKEQLKANYANRRDLCLLSLKYTGGFHPKSSWCGSCPLANSCAQETNGYFGYDVVSMRRSV